MFRRPEVISEEALLALQSGLSALPVPEAASDFGASIHAALSNPEPGWLSTLWTSVRPALSAAALSLIVTLALLKGAALTTNPHDSSHSGRAIVAYGSLASVGVTDPTLGVP